MSPVLLGPGDVLRIEVFGDTSLSGSYQLDSTGKLVFPLLGEIQASGQTLQTLKHQLNTALEADYILSPMVSVTMEELRSNAVNLFGDVTKPGRYPLTASMRLADLLSQAGGLEGRKGEASLERRVRIIRQEKAPLEISLYSLLVEGNNNELLQQGDVLYVSPPPMVFVVGEVTRPGPLLYERGLTVAKAIAMAGGRTREGAPSRVLLHAVENDKLKKKRIKSGQLLKPGTTIEVPISFF